MSKYSAAYPPSSPTSSFFPTSPTCTSMAFASMQQSPRDAYGMYSSFGGGQHYAAYGGAPLHGHAGSGSRQSIGPLKKLFKRK
ncbi:hypothetical protein SCHPADRAFT_907900 [Schizopora paradoxa]|uniref:Uncharacterized protein n=1 Tax=Schizopora paradoxa TaxID=27342 RepID=A0A0H2RWR5_9AGAM|nr:hypothetical protein SCHPADRAFT_907900 [Schizopora paradoxa]